MSGVGYIYIAILLKPLQGKGYRQGKLQGNDPANSRKSNQINDLAQGRNDQNSG